jgi:hypothetical protein
VSRKNHIAVVACQLVFLVFVALLFGRPANAQGLSSWWGSSAWFDWSDFRAEAGVRVFLARFVSGSISRVNQAGATVEYDLTQGSYAASTDPEPFREFRAAIYIDRLGLRYNDEMRRITRRGVPGIDVVDPTGVRIWRLEASTSRLGLDLDLVRYPFFKFGINADWNVEPVRFLDGHEQTNQTRQYSQFISYDPLTLGIHARAIPVRIREVPLTVQARARFPMPFVNRNSEARITDWEIGGGLRPAIWETSFIGLSSFSIGVEAGFRALYLDFKEEKRDFQLKANWQGAFFSIGAYF